MTAKTGRFTRPTLPGLISALLALGGCGGGDGSDDDAVAIPKNWLIAELLESEDAGDAGSPEAALDAAGNGPAAWYQGDGMRDNIWSNRIE